MITLKNVIYKRQKNQLILSNGSERADFVPMDYIFSQTGYVHSGIQLMKTYYPSDPLWSPETKISQRTKKQGVNYAWNYEYDDYHPLNIFEPQSSTLREIENIKRYGSDLHLTVTLDLSLSDNEIIRIIQLLNNYGRIFLRINHEANGYWFRSNKQHSYKEVNDFFIRCHKLIKSNSSQIYTVFNITGDLSVHHKVVDDKSLRLGFHELRGALRIADYWSIDKYTSLNYSWPFQKSILDENCGYWKHSVDDWWNLVNESYIKMIWYNEGIAKPLFINEFNSDSDVDGYDTQAEVISSIYSRLAKGNFDWIEGIVLYQFRDHGGLGLEKGTLDDFVQLPALKAYKEVISQFKPLLQTDDVEWQYDDYTFNWSNSDSIRGLKIDSQNSLQSFTNNSGTPVFIVSGAEQQWKRLETRDQINLDGLQEFYLFVPPFKYPNQQLSSHFLLRNVKDELNRMCQ